jgi:diguanylate cyclase (GGDEF)-like protein
VDRTTESPETCPLHQQDCPITDRIRQLEAEVKKLRALAQTDMLTGYFNLRYFLAALEAEMERTRRTALPTSLIMIDLDHFKRINDRYGHEAGNKALHWSCKVWRKRMRRIDVPCRYGGEEFAVILPGTHVTQAVRAAERLRLALSNAPLQLNGDWLTLTASFGVDVFEKGDVLSVKAFVDRTDRYLMDAKRNGRDRVAYGEKAPPPSPTYVTDTERASLLEKQEKGRAPDQEG